jgi:hypothetical protein
MVKDIYPKDIYQYIYPKDIYQYIYPKELGIETQTRASKPL